jgi:hypothetical protein
MKNGRRKGAKGELQVAALLQDWWRQLEPDAIFRRTPSSGGWARGDVAKLAFETAGDLTTTAVRFPFCVEVKRREAFDTDNFLKGRASPVWNWWLQAQTQGAEQDGEPMLWLRRNHEPWMVLLRFAYVRSLPASVQMKLAVTCHTHDWRRGWASTRGAVPIMYYARDLLARPPNFFATC